MKNKTILKQLIKLREASQKLPALPEKERRVIELENRFESVYASNKLENNSMTKKEARKAIKDLNE